jgi:hypothetical protein
MTGQPGGRSQFFHPLRKDTRTPYDSGWTQDGSTPLPMEMLQAARAGHTDTVCYIQDGWTLLPSLITRSARRPRRDIVRLLLSRPDDQGQLCDPQGDQEWTHRRSTATRARMESILNSSESRSCARHVSLPRKNPPQTLWSVLVHGYK